MSLKGIRVFNLKNWGRLVKYSIASRMINSLPKGLKRTYDFIVMLEREQINFEKVDGHIRFKYPVMDQERFFCISETSSDSDVFQQIILEKEYEFVVNLLSQHSIEVNTIIDAGANTGFTSMYLSAYFPNSRIIALEPNKDTFQRLRQNIELNNLSKIELVPLGLWNKDTYLKANYDFRDQQAWSFRLEETSDENDKLFEVISMTTLMKKYQLQGVDLLKIDVEGAEKEIFDANADLSWLKAVKVIAVEIHDEFECRENIEGLLRNQFELSFSGELTIGVNKACLK